MHDAYKISKVILTLDLSVICWMYICIECNNYLLNLNGPSLSNVHHPMPYTIWKWYTSIIENIFFIFAFFLFSFFGAHFFSLKYLSILLDFSLPMPWYAEWWVNQIEYQSLGYHDEHDICEFWMPYERNKMKKKWEDDHRHILLHVDKQIRITRVETFWMQINKKTRKIRCFWLKL